jgi:hypothetical protein
MTASYRVSPGGGIEGCSGFYTSRPKDRLFAKRSAGWYLIDFARSRHTNPARIPVIVNADWYYTSRFYREVREALAAMGASRSD